MAETRPASTLAVEVRSIRPAASEQEVLELLRRAREARCDGTPVAAALAERLGQGDPLLNGRGPKEVERMRAGLLATLGALGTPEEARAAILGELVHGTGHQALLLAAAARAAGGLPAGDPAILAALVRLLAPGADSDEVWIDAERTTVRLEVVRALGRLSSGEEEVRQALALIAAPAPGSALEGETELRRAADEALASIESRAARGECCGRAADVLPLTVDAWRAPGQRTPCRIAEVALEDQDGRSVPFGDLLGRPMALTFFYSRCANPNKCPLTIARLGGLRRALESEGIADRVTLAALSLDPGYDAPATMRRFAQKLGMPTSERIRLLRTRPEWLDDLVAELGVPVAFGAGQVSAHGLALLILDREGALVRRHEHLIWDEETVCRDLRRLLHE